MVIPTPLPANEQDVLSLYRVLIAHLPGAAVFVVDAGLRYVLADGPVLRQIGKTPADFEGKTVNEALPPHWAPQAETNYRQALTGQPFHHIHHWAGHDYETSGTPLRNRAGAVHAVLSVSYDITERARAEAALQVLNEQLEERVAERTEALRRSHTQLRELAMHMETAREDERTRIAREVHDDLGGHLTALKIEMGALVRGRESDDALKHRLNEMKSHIDEIVAIVRRIGSDLRPPVLDDYGLIPALEWHAREFERRTGLSCQLDLVEDKPSLSREKRTAVFRAFQEALTNVARHAQASQVNVAMVIDEGELVLVIEDNGIGISQETLASSRSLGLKGMEERLKEVGGRVEIEGRTGQGTVVEIRMPISPAGAPRSNG
jgi:PAS domain S-box-containing protein